MSCAETLASSADKTALPSTPATSASESTSKDRAHHRCGGKDTDVGHAQPFQALKDRVPHVGRDPDLGQRFAVPARLGTEDVASVNRVAEHLFEHERVA